MLAQRTRMRRCNPAFAPLHVARRCGDWNTLPAALTYGRQLKHQARGRHVHPPSEAHRRVQAHHGGCGRQAAARVRLRRDQRDRPVPAVRRFPQRPAGGLPGRLPVASAPRHRDHHLRAGGHGRPWRQPRQPRHAGCRRRAVDDRGQRHPASGDAAGRPPGPHARLPAVGQPAVGAEDDPAALPGHRRQRHPGDRRRRRHHRPDRLR